MVGVRTVGVCELFPSQVRGLGYSGGVIVVTNGYDYCISVWRTLVFHQSLNFFFLTKLYWNRLFIALFNRLWLAAFILDHFPLFTSRWRVGAIHNGGLKCCYQKVGERTKRTQLKLGDVYQMSTYEHARKLSQSVSKRRYTHRHTVAGAAVSYCRSNCLPYLRTCIHVPGLKGSLSQHHMFLTDFSQLAILRKCKYQQPHCEKCTVNRE